MIIVKWAVQTDEGGPSALFQRSRVGIGAALSGRKRISNKPPIFFSKKVRMSNLGKFAMQAKSLKAKSADKKPNVPRSIAKKTVPASVAKNKSQYSSLKEKGKK